MVESHAKAGQLLTSWESLRQSLTSVTSSGGTGSPAAIKRGYREDLQRREDQAGGCWIAILVVRALLFTHLNFNATRLHADLPGAELMALSILQYSVPL